METINPTQLSDLWEQTSDVPGSFLLLPVPKHPLTLYIGSLESGRKSFIFESKFPIKFSKSSREIRIDKERSGDQFRYFLTLNNPEFEDVFISFIADLVNYSATAHTINEATLLMEDRFESWKKLFMSKMLSPVDPQKMKGLFGELFIVYQLINRGISAQKVIDGWKGPDKEAQDFDFGSTWVEVKSSKTGSNMVTISSLEQLSNPEKGFLCVQKINMEREDGLEGYINLEKLETRVLELLEGKKDLIQQLQAKMFKYGYFRLKEQNELYFKVISQKFFNVDSNFPALRRLEVPEAIINAKYVIDLDLLAPWQSDFSDLEEYVKF